MVGIAERAELAFQEDGLARFHGVQEERRGVRDVRGDPVAKLTELGSDLLHGERRLPVELLQEDVLRETNAFASREVTMARVEKLVHLQADLQVLVRVERRDARLGGAEALLAQALLLQRVEEDVVRQQHLRALGDAHIGPGHAPAGPACRSRRGRR